MISKLLHTMTAVILLVAWLSYLNGQWVFYYAALPVMSQGDANRTMGIAMAVTALGPLLLAYLWWTWKPKP